MRRRTHRDPEQLHCLGQRRHTGARNRRLRHRPADPGVLRRARRHGGSVRCDGRLAGMGRGSIDLDPLFVYRDVHLQRGSPCIDSGDPNSMYDSQTDLDGEPRVVGGRVDIGLDEFADADQDGLPDWWETRHFGAPPRATPWRTMTRTAWRIWMNMPGNATRSGPRWSSTWRRVGMTPGTVCAGLGRGTRAQGYRAGGHRCRRSF